MPSRCRDLARAAVVAAMAVAAVACGWPAESGRDGAAARPGAAALPPDAAPPPDATAPPAATASQPVASPTPPMPVAGPSDPDGPLRVCADPNNLPFTDRRLRGFENRLVEVLADELGTTVEYTWWAQRRGFLRNTLNAGRCDVVPGLPTSSELALVTAPYYRSTYVFVSRGGPAAAVRSFDDEALRRLIIGVQLIGDDYANTPPAHALAARGIVDNVRGYPVYGDYREESPPRKIVEAVARGEVDVAVVWGPLAGYWAPRQQVPLHLVPVSPRIDLPFLPFVFDLGLGVRRGDEALRDRLEQALARRRGEIDAILAEYGVPRLDRPPGGGAAR